MIGAKVVTKADKRTDHVALSMIACFNTGGGHVLNHPLTKATREQ
jgi:hypothetical protein